MIELLKKLSNLLPRQVLVTIYKAFIRPHLDYGDVLYDQAFNNSFHAKMEFIQYNFIQPSPNSVFDIRNPAGIKLIARLRLGLSHL